MRRSTTRIITTHTGSLPRPANVVEQLLAVKKGDADRNAFNLAVREAVSDVIAKQRAAGIDIVNDGEQGRADYTVHVVDRLTGFEGQSDAAARPRRAGVSRACRTAQAVCLAVPASSGLLRPGGVEGFRRGGSRHRPRQGRHGEGGRRGILHDLAVARPDRAVSEEPPLQDRRGIPVRARRRDEARIQGDRRRGLHRAARLPGPRDVLRALSRHQPRRLPQDHRA